MLISRSKAEGNLEKGMFVYGMLVLLFPHRNGKLTQQVTELRDRAYVKMTQSRLIT